MKLSKGGPELAAPRRSQARIRFGAEYLRRRRKEACHIETDASTLGKVDLLRGFKENVIMGHLIPAGTGLPTYKQLKITLPFGAELPIEEPKPAEASAS